MLLTSSDIGSSLTDGKGNGKGGEDRWRFHGRPVIGYITYICIGYIFLNCNVLKSIMIIYTLIIFFHLQSWNGREIGFLLSLLAQKCRRLSESIQNYPSVPTQLVYLGSSRKSKKDVGPWQTDMGYREVSNC